MKSIVLIIQSRNMFKAAAALLKWVPVEGICFDFFPKLLNELNATKQCLLVYLLVAVLCLFY